MNGLVERRNGAASQNGRAGSRAGESRSGASLLGLMHEGFYLLFLLKNGAAPQRDSNFMDRIADFLAEFDRAARQQRIDSDDIDAAKYAYCAALDEIILTSPHVTRDDWECRPLQLVLFGDQLAGEHFFQRLEALRGRGGMRVQALQVFHLCLLLGFQGKYAHDGAEKLSYLTARLGDEIAHIKGKSRGFAPRAERPDQVSHKRRSDLPLWAVASVFALLAMAAYVSLQQSLTRATQAGLAGYSDLVKLAPPPASLTITLP